MLKATKHLIIARVIALATLEPVATYAQSITTRVATVAPATTVAPPNAYTAVLNEVRDRLGFLEGLLLDPGRDGNTVVYADHDVKCPGGLTFTLSSPGGKCETTFDAKGNTNGGFCFNDKDDDAVVDCNKDSGKGACVETTGKGKCQIKQ